MMMASNQPPSSGQNRWTRRPTSSFPLASGRGRVSADVAAGGVMPSYVRAVAILATSSVDVPHFSLSAWDILKNASRARTALCIRHVTPFVSSHLLLFNLDAQ